MSSRAVLDRNRIARTIVATARMHAQQVGERMQEVFAPAVAEGETSPDFVTLLRQLARFLQQRLDRMVATENLHFTELDDDLEPRRRRDAAAVRVRNTLLGVRTTLAGVFGTDFGEKVLGVEGSTPDDPLALYRQAQEALNRLNGNSIPLPPRRLDGFALDLETLAAQLQPAFDDLGEALEEVTEQTRLKETTLRDRDLALDALDVAVGGIGRMVIGLDRLAGFPEYAERIRITLPPRRRRGTPSPDEAPLPEGGGEGGAGDPTPPDPEEPSPAPPTGELSAPSDPPEEVAVPDVVT